VLPVLTRYLTPTDYGIVSMMGVLVGVAGPFIGLNIHGAISVKYFGSGRAEIARYVGNCFVLLCASTAAVSMVFWLFARPISAAAAFPRDWLPIVIIISISQFVILVLLTLWQVEDRPVWYGAFQVLQAVLNIGLTILLVVGLHLNWQGRVEAQAASVLLCAVIAFVVLRRMGWLRFSYDSSDLQHALKFGVPLIPHAIGALLIAQTGRIFITNMVSVADTGVYMVGYQLAMVVELLAASFNKAYVPWLYSRLSIGEPRVKRRIVKLTYAYFAAILVFAASLSVLLPSVVSFVVGKDFAAAGQYTAWIALGFAFSGMYYMVANYIFYAGATHILAWITLATAAMNILFNYVLITMNGAVGAAQASALAMFMSFALTWMLSARVYAMPWKLAREI
jgi:O-antigen/teichoic acid export membrane protein